MLKFGITLGDPTGISSEILLKSIRKLPKGSYILYGSKKVIDKSSKLFGLENPFFEVKTVDEVNSEGFYLINAYDGDFTLGKPSVESGKASILYLEMAVKDAIQGKLNGIVTLPISKEYILKAGFRYRGHTDYLANVSQTKDYLMMLLCEKLKVALLTTHIPLRDVPKYVTKDRLRSKLNLLIKELKTKFKIKNPKVAVVGLNPHKSDNGKIGDEEINIIDPVVMEFKRNNFNVIGSLSPDTAFINYKEYDSYLAMYHDQGLIPLKLLCFKRAVNITLGLPFIRTSVDHGTGFDIAGKNIADPTSFIEAVKLALKLSKLK